MLLVKIRTAIGSRFQSQMSDLSDFGGFSDPPKILNAACEILNRYRFAISVADVGFI